MYFKLALRNVKKSFKDYLIYFLTIAFSICLFYTFNSFQEQQAVLKINESQQDIIVALQQVMSALSTIVAIILAFLIVYANNFLIKRRKKELGLYTLLGMNKSKISLVLIIETFLIGLLSLIVGIFAGLIASQFLSVMTANLFDVELDYHFIFSIEATISTIFSYALIFFIIMIFNSFILNKYKLIDLLHADQAHESLRLKSMYSSVLICLLSLLLLGYAYYTAWSNGIQAFEMLATIIPAGIIGTILFFMSLSGFLLRFIQSSKHMYFKKLNMFALRQINASINSNFLSMSVVCILLLFSIGALSTGLSLNSIINKSLEAMTPFDYSYASLNNYNIKDIKTDLNVDTSVIQEDFLVYEYYADEVADSLTPYMSQATIEKNSLLLQTTSVYEVLPLSQFNLLRKHMELPPISLSQNEGYLFTTADFASDMINDILAHKPNLSLYGETITIANDTFDPLYAATTTATGMFGFCVVLNDNLIPSDASIRASYWNVNFKEGVDSEAFQTSIVNAIDERNDELELYGYYTSASTLVERVHDDSRGMSVTFTYIGLYLGFVFLIASTVILALQQLSQASDNRKQYTLLRKIGADEKVINHSILLQLGIYFTMPLLLAIAHSIVGIQVVNSLTIYIGKTDIFLPSFITACIIIVVYGSYFLITYSSCKAILKS